MSIEQNTKILASDVTTSLSGKAPTSHASANTTYGIGTGSNYGHVKLSDSTSSTSAASSGIAASPKAVKAAYDKAVEAANSGGSKSVGDLWFGIDPKSKPANVQLYAGQSLNRSSYAAHWAFVNGGNRTVISESEWQAQVKANGFCPYYSSGNGSSTYRMPLVKGVHPKFVEALASAGAYTKAGLPNINGTVSAISASVGWNNESGLPDSGAFNMTYSTEGGAQYNGSNVAVKITLDASLSNSIYGNSDTVQPPAINMVVGEYVVGTVATIGEANATSMLASITTLESNVGTLSNGVGKAKAYITETWRSGTEWYRKWSDGWIEQGGKFPQTGDVTTQLTFYLPFADTKYSIFRNLEVWDNNFTKHSVISFTSKTTTGATYYYANTDSRWWAVGKGA